MKHPLLLTVLLLTLATGRSQAQTSTAARPAAQAAGSETTADQTTTGQTTTGQTTTSQTTADQFTTDQTTTGQIPAGETTTAQTAVGQTPAEKEIFAAMNDATAKWNKGDLDAYMALYDNNATMMLSSGRVGLDSIRGMYVKYYFPGGHPKQELAYDTYQLTMLGKDYALLTGRFILKANDKYKERTGTFSLTMVHRKDGWKILHDHSG